MTTSTTLKPYAPPTPPDGEFEVDQVQFGDLVGQAINNALTAAGIIALGVVLFKVLQPLIETSPRLLGSETNVEQTYTTAVASLLTILAPFAAYVVCGTTIKSYLEEHSVRVTWHRGWPQLEGFRNLSARRGIIATLTAAFVVYIVISMCQFVFQVGPFAERPSLQMQLTETADGILVEEVIDEGTAAEAGIEAGDLITGIRRAEVTFQELDQTIAESDFGDILRLRILRDGEEEQYPVEVVPAIEIALRPLVVGLFIALLVAFLAIFWPGGTTPYVLLALIMVPLLIGYLWLIIASFSTRTQGLLPKDSEGSVGGWTLDNWDFLTTATAGNQSIWQVTLTTFIIAILMTVIVLAVSSMAGYALSRMKFPGRKTFLSFTLILHGFPAVTLLIAVFFVLRNIGTIPYLGDYFGFNTRGGIALVMVAFELPLGIWLMKGFFDGIPWDMERSALIDGASRWRTFWEIMLPQIRPGLLALGIFAFISGWGAYLIPQTYSIGTRTATLAVYINQLTSETSPVNWNQVAAVGLYQMIPVFIIFVFAQEYLLNIYAGGSKGTS